MNKMVLSISVALGFAYGVQAYAVYENFGGDHSSGSVTTDHVEYRVVVASGETLNEFKVAYSKTVSPIAFYLQDSAHTTIPKTSNPGDPFFDAADNGSDSGFRGAFTQDGHVGATATASPELYWGVNLTAGTYYFGYTVANGTYNLFNAATAEMGSGFLVSDDTQAVNSGLGPVHAIEAAPEPTSLALLGLGAAALALRRRVRKA